MHRLNDLMARLERAEERARELDTAFAWQASRTAAPVSPDAELAGLKAQVEAQARTLSGLRQELREACTRYARELEEMQAALDNARQRLPVLVEEARAGGAPDRQDYVRRQIGFMQKRLREQFDAALEEHAGARTREMQMQLTASQSAVAELEKQAAANDAKVAALRTTLGDLTLAAARFPGKSEPSDAAPWHLTWRRVAAWLMALVVVALISWQVSKRQSVGTPVSEAALLDQAGEAAVRKDYARAETLYREVLKKNPTQEEALRGLGNCLLLDSEAVLHTLPPP